MEWYLKVLKNYAVFKGRARRKEYWMFFLFNLLIGIVLSIIDNLFGFTYKELNLNGILGNLYNLFIFIPTLAVTTRRLHDVNKSGWLLVLFYVTIAIVMVVVLSSTIDKSHSTPIFTIILILGIIGFAIYLFILSVINGHVGSNKYGPDPKSEAEELELEDHLI